MTTTSTAAAAATTETTTTTAAKTEATAATTEKAGTTETAAAAATESAAAAGAPYRPEGLPDHLFGKSDKETIENINKAYKGAREELGKKSNKPPEMAEGYTLTLPDDIKGKVVVPDANGKDPVFEIMKPVLHKAGISNEAMNIIVPEFYKAVAGEIAKRQESATNDPNAGDFDFKQLGGTEKAKPLQDASIAWIDAQKERLNLNDAELEEFKLMTNYSQGLNLLNKMRAFTSEKPIPADFTSGNGEAPATAEKIADMQNDQRYIDGDPAFHKLVQDEIAKKQAQERAK